MSQLIFKLDSKTVIHITAIPGSKYLFLLYKQFLIITSYSILTKLTEIQTKMMKLINII